MMLLITEYALRLAQGMSFETPLDLLEQLLPAAYAYGKQVTGR